MTRTIAILAAALAIQGCTQAPDDSRNVAANESADADVTPVPIKTPGTITNAEVGPTPEASQTPADAAAPGTSLPPADAEYRYVGRWAATTALCKSGAWEFEPKHLSTAGEVSCDFSDVQKTPGGYDIGAQCLAEGNSTSETIKVRFAESAKAMMVESKTFQPVGLIYCGAD